MPRVKVMDERMLNVAFQQPVQIARGIGENASESYKTTAYKMVDQYPCDVCALTGLVVEGKSDGALAFQCGGEGNQVGNRQRDKAEAGEGFAQGQQAHRSGARGNIAVTEGSEGDAAEVEGFDAMGAFGFHLDVEARGHLRPVKQGIPEDEQCYKRRDDPRQEERADVIEQLVPASARAMKGGAPHQPPNGSSK